MQAEATQPQGSKRKAEVAAGGDIKRQLNRAGTWAIPTKLTATVLNVPEMSDGTRGSPITLEEETPDRGLHSSSGEAQGKPYCRVVRYRFLICE